METIETIKGIIEPLLQDLGYELVEVQLRKEQVGLVLRLIIYKDDGIGLDDCTKVSREVGYLLEVDDPISSAYTLEVSSPGLDRALVSRRDFERNIGKRVKVVYESCGEKSTVTGTIISVEKVDGGEELLLLKVEKENLQIDLAHIKKARLVIEF